MKNLVKSIAILVCASGGPAIAQMVTTEEATEICPERPGEPAIIENMDFREAHRTLLLQRMYTAVSFQEIVETGDCSCDKRFPPWEPVVTYYLENYAMIEDRHEIYAAQDPYDDAVNATRRQVREICVAAGNWN